MRVDFYHLTRSPVGAALPAIAERSLASGKRLLVVSGDEEQLGALDRELWTWKADSFLPHGRTGEQPILLAGTFDGADHDYVAVVDGLWREDALRFERVFHFFSEESIDGARSAWRSLVGQEAVERHYWKQEEGGRWVEGP